MITGNPQDMARMAKALQGRVAQALEILSQLDVKALPVGKTPLDGDNIYASVNEYATEPWADRRPEKHEQYIDIQIVAAGREIIGYGDVENAGPMTEDKRETNDVSFYASVAQEKKLELEEGQFAIFYPWEVHRPNCQFADSPEQVKKVVVKVRA